MSRKLRLPDGHGWHIGEYLVQCLDGLRKIARAQVLVPRGHSQILVTEQLRNGVNIGPTHAQPARCCVTEIVQREILDSNILAGSDECHTHLGGVYVREDPLCRFGAMAWHGIDYLQRELVQINDSAVAVLRLW